MKKSTRAIAGLLAIDALLALGAAWMVWQTRTGAWTAPNSGEAISTITATAGGAIGIVTVILLMAFALHRRHGN